MTRITPVFRPSDYPGEPDAATRDALTRLFAQLAPGAAEPVIDAAHAGMAVAALSPAVALPLAQLTTTLVTGTTWSPRGDLVELIVQAVNLRWRSGFSFEARLSRAETSGLGLQRLAALPYWRTSTLFDDEQRLLLGYVEAAVGGDVPDALFAQVRDRYGEKATVELTVLVGCFSLWAMLINAADVQMPA